MGHHPLQDLEIQFETFAVKDLLRDTEGYILQTIQSKLVAHLVPPVCTNSHKSGTTWWPAEGMYIWVQPTYSHLSNIISLALYYDRQSGQIYYVDVVPADHDKHIVVGQYWVCDQPNNVYMVSADHYIFIMVGWYWMCDHTNNVYMVLADHDKHIVVGRY